eukprot:1514202-Amphidinium_carterae.1
MKCSPWFGRAARLRRSFGCANFIRSWKLKDIGLSLCGIFCCYKCPSRALWELGSVDRLRFSL